MIHRRFRCAFSVTLLCLVLPSVLGAGEPVAAEDQPLAPFARLMGGKWVLDGSYQTFEWGVGKQSVRSRSYFVVEGEDKLVSEGSWFWHPGAKTIKGFFTAIDMPVSVFDYTTTFEDGNMVNELRAYSPEGKETIFLETWTFVDDDQFEWTLSSETEEGPKKVMGGTYERK